MISRKLIAGAAAMASVLGLAGPLLAARGTPTVTFITVGDGAPRSMAFLAETSSASEIGGYPPQVLSQSLYLSADPAAVKGGLTVYFLRVDGGRVAAVRSRALSSTALAGMARRAPSVPRGVTLPGNTFLPGDMFPPGDMFTSDGGSQSGSVRTPAGARTLGTMPRPRNAREAMLFDHATSAAKGGSGLMVVAFPAAGAGGGFFMPADGTVRK